MNLRKLILLTALTVCACLAVHYVAHNHPQPPRHGVWV